MTESLSSSSSSNDVLRSFLGLPGGYDTSDFMLFSASWEMGTYKTILIPSFMVWNFFPSLFNSVLIECPRTCCSRKICKKRHLNRDPKQDKAETSVYLGDQCALLRKESAKYLRAGLVSNIQDLKSSKSVEENKQQ